MISQVSFRTKISLAMIAMLLLFGGALAFMISRTASMALIEESKKRGISGALHLSFRIGEPLLAMDFLRMKDLVDEVIRTGEDVAFVFVLERQGKPLVHTFSGGFPVDLAWANNVGNDEAYRVQLITTDRELIYDFAVPVVIGNERLGTVRIGVSRERIGEAVERLLWTILLTAGFAMAVAALVGTLIARTVTKKIHLLRRSAEEIARGNLDIQTLPAPKIQCWEFMGCRKESCPAYGNSQHRCWYVAGTLCPLCTEGEFTQKVETCRNCAVYRMNSGDEIQDLAEYFDLMALMLRNRLDDLERSQADLRQQQHLFRTILDATPDLLGLYDLNVRFQAVNKAFCRFFGKDEGAIVGRSDFDLLPGEQAESDRSEGLKVLESGMSLQSERKIETVFGERWFHVVKTPVTGPDGGVIGLLSNGRDITEFKKLQERIIQAQKLESLGQLAAGVAHELNTPLGIILGYTQLMLREFAPDSEAHETLRIMEKHSRICKKIVSDLLRFSRNTETDKKPLNLDDILDQVLTIVDHTFRLERIVIERRPASDLPLIFGDREKLQQVFLNLLNNGYDAIGSEGKIILTTRHDVEKDEVVAFVADTGPGIPPDIRHKIFDPFFTTKPVGKGTGLGLSVTFGIVKDHGGQIEVESFAPSAEMDSALLLNGSNLGHGTVFTLRFPVYRVKIDPEC